LVVSGFEFGASYLLGRPGRCSVWATLPVLSCDGFFEIRSHELFVPKAGFKPPFSWSLPPE
jgi:hypothetical protein